MQTSEPDPFLAFQSNPLAWLAQARRGAQGVAVVRAQGAVFTRHDEAVPHGRRLRRRPDPRRADHARQLRDAGLGIGPAGPAMRAGPAQPQPAQPHRQRSTATIGASWAPCWDRPASMRRPRMPPWTRAPHAGRTTRPSPCWRGCASCAFAWPATICSAPMHRPPCPT
ncbi:hypothetical protein LP420_21955 [Massilia sp. B-10]|nr:hypothetical protein LP420_21955 [Massilia sp. B-10]